MKTTRSLRRRAAITTYGVGALVDFPHETLLAAGLDQWPTEPEAESDKRGGFVLRDRRLEKLLQVEYLRAAPTYDKERKEKYELPFVRFPTWLRCPRCHRLIAAGLTSRRIPRCENPTPPSGSRVPCSKLGRKKRLLVPVRFLAACPDGHLEDFPWSAWVHTPRTGKLSRDSTCSNGGKPELYIDQTGYGGLSNVLIRCRTCKASRTLTGAGGENGVKALACSGKRPWLGQKNLEDEPCDRNLSLVQKGASRLHQPAIESALRIPRSPAEFEAMLKRPKLRKRLRLDDLEASPPTPEEIADVADYEELEPSVLQQAVEAHLRTRTELPSDRLGLLYEEYQTLSTWKDYELGSEDLVVRQADVDRLSPELRPFFSQLLLVDRLTETQVLVGFSRLGTPQAPFDVKWRHLARQRKDWLPAYRVHGEGIFLTLERDRLATWSSALRSGIGKPAPSHLRGIVQEPEFYLLHTLAHVLIRRLSFDCGYGSSSLRERLYCHVPKDPEDPRWMAGILIYTAAGDSEGTLGGLVRQGEPENLSPVLINAIEEARWCSADPLCSESRGQGPGSKNLAACHTCCLLPETSCEERNQRLDRTVLVGDSTRPGFFKDVGISSE